MTHTPTPWEFQEFEIVHEIQKGLVQSVPIYTNRIAGTLNPCSDDWDTAQANAAHIVKCVNAHEALLECLKKLVSDLQVGMALPSPTVEYEINLALKAIALAEKLA